MPASCESSGMRQDGQSKSRTAAEGRLTTRATGALARIRSPRPVNAGVRLLKRKERT